VAKAGRGGAAHYLCCDTEYLSLIPNVQYCRHAASTRTSAMQQLPALSETSLVSINLLTPNVNYSGRTAPLTSEVAFYIFIQQI